MARTYEPIASVTLGSTTASVTLGSGGTLPQTYTDLIIVTVGTSTAGDNIGFQFNGDTGTNYSQTYLIGNGSTASSGRESNYSRTRGGILPTSGVPANVTHIMSYSNANVYKTLLTRGGEAGWGASAWVGLWRNTAAITSIVMFPQSTGSFSSGTTISVFGIRAA